MATWRTAGSASAFLNSPARHLRRNSRAARSNRRTSATRVSRPMRLGAAAARGAAAFAFRFDRFARLMSPQLQRLPPRHGVPTRLLRPRRRGAALPEPVERLVVDVYRTAR